jgi:hypothetical protein
MIDEGDCGAIGRMKISTVFWLDYPSNEVVVEVFA